MREYKVHWSGEPHSNWETVEATSPREAYESFLKKKETHENLVVIVEWGVNGFEVFGEEEQKAQEKEQKAQEEERKRFALELTEIMMSDGFDSLNGREIRQISEIVDHSFSNPHAQSNEETELVKAAVTDSAAYRYLTLRNSSLAAQQQAALLETLGTKLSDISSKASGIKVGTTVAGMAAARHLGEEMAEGFGED